MNSDSSSPKLCTHQLDIVGQFCSYAEDLLGAVKKGKRTHGTGNIAESGDPFEIEFRKLFSDSLPASIAVWPGYFMDQQLNISNQQDILFCDLRETLQLPPSHEIAQRYVLLPSVHIFGQLKNTASSTLLSSALQQNAKAIAQSREMRRHFPNQQDLPQEMSILVFGQGGSAEDVQIALGKR
jgi:hypothetical protein